MFLEVQTGRGRIDLLITHNQRKYIVETKIWEGIKYYTAGKKQLSAYLNLEAATEGYYVVFDHRRALNPAQRQKLSRCEDPQLRYTCDAGTTLYGFVTYAKLRRASLNLASKCTGFA